MLLGGSLVKKIHDEATKRTGKTLEEVYERDLQDVDVKEFMKKYDISTDSDIYKRGRSAIRQFVVIKNNDSYMIPKLRLTDSNIWVDEMYRSERLEEYFTARPKASYDSGTSAYVGVEINSIEATAGNIKALGFIKNFIKTYKGLNRQQGMWLVGSPGIGKTYLMGALANELKKNNVAFEFLRTDQFLNDLKAMMNQQGSNLDKRLHELKANTPVLILDDMGLERASDWNVRTLTDLLIYRHDHALPTFFTSNLTQADYMKYLLTGKDTERTTVERLYRKAINPLSEEISMAGEDKRKGGQVFDVQVN